jgi:hypothetical protein
MLSMASLACSFTWFMFGYYIGDFVVMIPNVIGVVLSSLQLGLLAMYGQRKVKDPPGLSMLI